MEVRGQTVLTSVELLLLFTLRAWERSSTAAGVRRHTLPPIQTRLFTHSCRQRERYMISFLNLSKLHTYHFNKVLLVTAQQKCTSRPSEQSCSLICVVMHLCDRLHLSIPLDSCRFQEPHSCPRSCIPVDRSLRKQTTDQHVTQIPH